MKSVEKIVIYTVDGIKKAHIFYKDGTDRAVSMNDNQPAEKNEVYQIMHRAIIDNNMTMEEFKKYLNSPNSRFIVGKSIKSEDEYEFINSFRKANDNYETKNVAGYNVNVNKTAFPSILTEEDFEEDLEEEKKDGLVKTVFKKAKKKFKESRLGVKITTLAIATTMIFGLFSCANRKSLDGQMVNSDISYVNTETNTEDDNTIPVIADVVETEFDKLLAQSTSLRQREVMQNVSDNLDYFNVEFANAHKEAGKNIKACITWDEMIALQVAVNDYTDEELREIFPQLKVSSTFVKDTLKNYNKANLQLMMSYIIETKDSRVNAYKLVESTEGQDFVKKYEDMYFAAHEATGSTKLELVKKFYDSVRKDFNLDKATDYKQYPSYYQLVSNIISAGEMEFQNLDVDYTLTDAEIARFQSINLCEIARDKIENHLYKIIESTQKYCYGSKDGGSKDGNDSTIYDQFREEKIRELKEKDSYFTTEENRDISKYDEFIKRVNKEVECFTEYKENSGSKVEENCKTETSVKNETKTSTRTEVKTTYKTTTKVTNTTDRNEAINMTSKEQVEKAEAEVDCKVEEENQKRKEEAEKAAEAKREELQKEADEQAKKNEEEVKKDQEDLEEKIEEANKKIENDEVVNEKDLEHDVEFDDDHSDSNGNLDESVKDITTDGTGANEALPDPNVTGAEFDKKAEIVEDKKEETSSSNTNSSNTNSTNTNNSSNSSSTDEGFYTEEVTTNNNVTTQETTVTTSGNQTIIEYEEPINIPLTNEQLVDAYINSLEQSSYDESAKVLTK